jgi:acyl carrier protein
MSNEGVVTEIAASLMLLDDKKQLVPLDSLTMVDFVTALEQKTGLILPPTALRMSNFRSIESVAELVSTLRAGG